VRPELFFDDATNVLTLQFGHDYNGAAGQAAISQALEELSEDQVTKLCGIILDCSRVMNADLRDSDRAKLASFDRTLERFEIDLRGMAVVVASTHPVILQRYERQRGQTSYPFLLAPNVEEARRLLEARDWT